MSEQVGGEEHKLSRLKNLSILIEMLFKSVFSPLKRSQRKRIFRRFSYFIVKFIYCWTFYCTILLFVLFIRLLKCIKILKVK